MRGFAAFGEVVERSVKNSVDEVAEAAVKKADDLLSDSAKKTAQESTSHADEAAEEAAKTTAQHSAILRKNLEDAGRPILPNEDAAHIVASGHPRHAEARGILDRAGIGVDDAINGGGLPSNTKVPNPLGKTTRNQTHTHSSMDKVTRELRQAERDGTVHDMLSDIESRRQSGNF
ncbi:AHH domain-containing protein [Verrucomicrobium sp. BvORR106]|uniref:AHH domain-containing protein n=1 Tax=Verrucomicrobium sp. BvORR106 TaxID=1403819 RepID=UPI000571C295|nr:AHH domain-containing protein [Verrucomicrobium sp. BvORR106]